VHGVSFSSRAATGGRGWQGAAIATGFGFFAVRVDEIQNFPNLSDSTKKSRFSRAAVATTLPEKFAKL
jgi:hypothetical protein